jgi:O-antigen biosynthesis protein
MSEQQQPRFEDRGKTVLPFTGERYTPEVGGEIALEHLHRYALACEYAPGKHVLDIASGEGYGSGMLAETARSVVGIDISPEAVGHAQRRYQKNNLQFVLGDCVAIPLSNATVDLIVSFETIEHLKQHEKMMREFRRVLRPEGMLLLSTPDKSIYSGSDNLGQKNPYHIKELYRHEFEALIAKYFKNYHMAGQQVIYGSAIFFENGSSNIRCYSMADKKIQTMFGLPTKTYLVTLASDAVLPQPISGIWEQSLMDSEVVHSLNQTVSGMLNSKSWRITKPLRLIMDFIRYLRGGR